MGIDAQEVQDGATDVAGAEGHVAQGYISPLERGEKKNPGIETLKKLARALGVPVTELLE